MLATERHPKAQPTTEKLPAELLATEHPGVVAHDVLCLVASQLAFFTGAIPVLELCRGQDRCVASVRGFGATATEHGCRLITAVSLHCKLSLTRLLQSIAVILYLHEYVEGFVYNESE